MAEEETLKQPQAGVEAEISEVGELPGLLKKAFRPPTDRMQEQVEDAVQTLAEYALREVNLVSADAVNTIEAIKAVIDKKLTDQVNQILHHDEFQKLESAWRGLHHLANNTESDENLMIKFLNISQDELSTTLKKFKGTRWDTSPIFKKIYTAEYDQWGGDIYGCLVGDYYFDNSPRDVELLGEMAKIAAAAHAPFIAGTAPSVMQMESWAELSKPAELASKFSGPEYAAWRSLRKSENSRYLGLALPRFLARLPYGAKTDPVKEFDFEEDTEGADSDKYTWANAAYAMGANINQAFKFYGWCSKIRGIKSGGIVTGLPVHTFPTDDGGVDMKCPTEIAIGDRREGELSKLGFLPLLHKKNSDYAAFIGAQSLQQPAQYDDPEATASANMSARLPYIFACSRFAHFLKCIVRDEIGGTMDRNALQRWLQKWITDYVVKDPENQGEEIRAKKPLADAKVTVDDVEGNPGYYNATFDLKPHYQLEGMNVTISLVSQLDNK